MAEQGDRIGRLAEVLGQIAGLLAGVVVLTAATIGLLLGLRLAEEETPIEPVAALSWPFTPAAELAVRFAPVLVFDSAERFRPVDRPGYVVRTDLRAAIERRRASDKRRTCNPNPTVASLPERGFRCGAETVQCRGDDRCYHYLAVDGLQVRNGATAYLGVQNDLLAGGRPTVYWHVDANQRVAQYWFFYVFNDFANWHAADWEQVTIQFDPAAADASSIAPLKIGYSSHDGGQFVLWGDLAPGTQRMGTHPVVYVARGSHANYFRAGAHRVPGCPRLGRFCVDRGDGRGSALVPGGYGLRQLARPAFSGDYSSGNFTTGGRVRLGSGIQIGDPQTRAVWTSPAQWLAGARPAD
jgi:hypothetical protein